MALHSNQVKSPQAGVTRTEAACTWSCKGVDRLWAFRFTDLQSKQMEFARAGDSASGDVLTLSSAREKARDYKIARKREGIDPRAKKRTTALRDCSSQPAMSDMTGIEATTIAQQRGNSEEKNSQMKPADHGKPAPGLNRWFLMGWTPTRPATSECYGARRR